MRKVERGWGEEGGRGNMEAEMRERREGRENDLQLSEIRIQLWK